MMRDSAFAMFYAKGKTVPDKSDSPRARQASLLRGRVSQAEYGRGGAQCELFAGGNSRLLVFRFFEF